MKVDYQGRQVEATEVDFFTNKEDFNEYRLDDGNILKVKSVLVKVLKIEGEKDPEGKPIYSVATQTIARVK